MSSESTTPDDGYVLEVTIESAAGEESEQLHPRFSTPKDATLAVAAAATLSQIDEEFVPAAALHNAINEAVQADDAPGLDRRPTRCAITRVLRKGVTNQICLREGGTILVNPFHGAERVTIKPVDPLPALDVDAITRRPPHPDPEPDADSDADGDADEAEESSGGWMSRVFGRGGDA